MKNKNKLPIRNYRSKSESDVGSGSRRETEDEGVLALERRLPGYGHENKRSSKGVQTRDDRGSKKHADDEDIGKSEKSRSRNRRKYSNDQDGVEIEGENR